MIASRLQLVAFIYLGRDRWQSRSISEASCVRQLPSCLPEPTRYHGPSGRGGGLRRKPRRAGSGCSSSRAYLVECATVRGTWEFTFALRPCAPLAGGTTVPIRSVGGSGCSTRHTRNSITFPPTGGGVCRYLLSSTAAWLRSRARNLRTASNRA